MFILHDSVPLNVFNYLKSTYPDLPIVLIGSDKAYFSQLKGSLGILKCCIISMSIALYLTQTPKPDSISNDFLAELCKRLYKLGLNDFYLMADPYNMVHCDGHKVVINISFNPSYSKSTNFSHYYSDCRDILAAIISFQLLNGKHPALDHLAAARNLVNTSEFYFNRNISIELLKEYTKNLNSSNTTYEI